MARFWHYLIALGAILATVLILTVKVPYGPEVSPEFPSDPSWDPAVNPIPPPPVTSAEASPLPKPGGDTTSAEPRAAWFELERGEGLTLQLTGTLRDGHVRSRLVESARRKVPELVEVVDGIEVDPSAAAIPGLDHLPGLVEALVSGTRDPFLRVEPEAARIGGSGGDEQLLAAIRGAFDSLSRDFKNHEDLLRFDPDRPVPETRMPLVLYLGTIDGTYVFEGSLPTMEQREALVAAGVEAVGPERFADHLRVSPSTVDETWMASLPALVGGLLDQPHGAMELIVVDRSVTLRGEVSDEKTKESLMKLADPAREAGYVVADGLTVGK